MSSVFTPEPEWVYAKERRNWITGEWVPLGAPLKIHRDDLDWLERMWLEGDRLDWELMLAGAP